MPSTTGTSQAKHWCFTINNPTLELDKQTFERASDLLYCVMQLEKGDEEETPHLQGIIGFNKKKRFNQVKMLHDRAHWEVARNVPASIGYCKKEETRIDGPWEYGEVPFHAVKGKRKDLDKVVDLIREGKSIREIFNEQPNAVVRYQRNIQSLTVLFAAPRNFATRCFLFYGPTGTGKTTAAMDRFEKPFKIICPKHGVLWFDGYDPTYHQTIVIDDFYGGIKWGELLQLTDRHPMQVQTKGGSVQFRPKNIIFTSNTHYETWYPKMDKAPLKRRFQEFGAVMLFENDGTRTLELGSFPDELRTPSPDVSQSSQEQPHEDGNHQDIALNSQSSE